MQVCIDRAAENDAQALVLQINSKGAVVSRDEILDQVWSENEFPTSRTIDNFIMRLRRLIEINPDSPEIIRSVRGVGYQLVTNSNASLSTTSRQGNPK